MKRIAWALFVCVCILFSALVTVMSLLCKIRLTAVSAEVSAMNKEIEALTEENRMLEAETEVGFTLEEIYNYATGVLGMQNPEPGQLFYLDAVP